MSNSIGECRVSQAEEGGNVEIFATGANGISNTSLLAPL